uniref:(northern house mosquito) hypothetical protein n=1 Tax=Culex pipiens TaxID=7175 RepID=A0A8D8A0W3_CULPI
MVASNKTQHAPPHPGEPGPAHHLPDLLPGAGAAPLVFRTAEPDHRRRHHADRRTRVLRVRRAEQGQTQAQLPDGQNRARLPDPVQRGVRRLSPRPEGRPGNVRHADEHRGREERVQLKELVISLYVFFLII